MCMKQKFKNCWSQFKSKIKCNSKQIIISSCVALFLLIGGYWGNNLPLFTGETLALYAFLEDINARLFDTPDDTCVVYINTAFDKELIPCVEQGDFEGSKPVILGNTEITDRRKLYQFLSLLKDVDYKYLIIDLRFEESLKSGAKVYDEILCDSVLVDDKLFALIADMPNVVVATHSGIKLATPQLEAKAALADYYSTVTSTNFVRYEYQDSIPYIPLAVYNDLQRQKGGDEIVCHLPFGSRQLKRFAVYTQGWRLCHNSLFVDFNLNEKTKDSCRVGENQGQVVMIKNQIKLLGKDMLMDTTFSTSKKKIAANCSQRFVIIGNLSEDLHDTYAGMKSGPTILYRALNCLNEGRHLVSIYHILFLFIVYFFISFFIIKGKSVFMLFNLKNDRHVISFLTDWLSFTTILLLINAFEYLFLREAYSFMLPLIVFTLLKFYKKYC